MNWFIVFCKSAIGKKLIMALTGLSFLMFLLEHLLGNIMVLFGPTAFLDYINHLHTTYKYLIPFVEFVLLIFGITHIIFGLTLFIQNLRARPIRYFYIKNAGGRTLGSITAPYTGLFILIFLVFHLSRFRLVDKTTTNDYKIMLSTFTDPLYLVFYLLAVIAVGLHVSHGAWSALQTFGINHPKYNVLIRVVSYGLSITIAGGLGIIPIYIFMSA